MRDFRIWWALFVFFAASSILALQAGYRRFRRLTPAAGERLDPTRLRRLRREGWRLACMALSVVTMTALVFAALSGAPPPLLLALRLMAVAGVVGVVALSVTR